MITIEFNKDWSIAIFKRICYLSGHYYPRECFRWEKIKLPDNLLCFVSLDKNISDYKVHIPDSHPVFPPPPNVVDVRVGKKVLNRLGIKKGYI